MISVSLASTWTQIVLIDIDIKLREVARLWETTLVGVRTTNNAHVGSIVELHAVDLLAPEGFLFVFRRQIFSVQDDDGFNAQTTKLANHAHSEFKHPAMHHITVHT